MIPILLVIGAVVVVPLALPLLRRLPSGRPSDALRIARFAAWSWLSLAAVFAGAALLGASESLAVAPELRWATPAHFLYVGFAVTTIAATAVRARPDRLHAVALVWVLVAMPLLALQIGFIPRVQWTGTLAVASGALLVAVSQLRLRADMPDTAAQRAPWGAAAAIVAGMALAVGYGLSTRFGFDWLTIDQMAATHGVVNALGFTVLSLVAWRRWSHTPRSANRA